MKFESRREHGMQARRLALSCCLALLWLLASCGGGDRVSTFVPQRLIVFGDEASVITPAGKKFTVNAVDSSGAIACNSNPNWVQYLAQVFGLVFAQCNAAAAPVTAIDYAAAGAKVADISAQIDQHLATGTFGAKDLVTVLVGANDVVEQYRLYPAQSEATLIATLEARGAALAGQVNRIAQAGGKVLVATVPDLSLTPFALAEKAANPATDDRAALIRRLLDRFNAKMRINLINDGSMIGLVFAEDLVQLMVRFPQSYGLVNVIDAACTTALPDCTTQTLTTGASGDTWLWADSLQLSAGGHRQLGANAEGRARNNPF